MKTKLKSKVLNHDKRQEPSLRGSSSARQEVSITHQQGEAGMNGDWQRSPTHAHCKSALATWYAHGIESLCNMTRRPAEFPPNLTRLGGSGRDLTKASLAICRRPLSFPTSHSLPIPAFLSQVPQQTTQASSLKCAEPSRNRVRSLRVLFIRLHRAADVEIGLVKLYRYPTTPIFLLRPGWLGVVGKVSLLFIG